MKRALLLVPLALAALLAWWLWWGSSAADRGGQREARGSRDPAAVHPGESLREVADDDEWGDVSKRPDLDEPVALFGTVYDFNGRPVWKAEVAVLQPQPSWTRFSSGQGDYELHFKKPGRYLVEARLHLDLAPQRKIVEIPEEGPPGRVDFHLKSAGYVFGEVVVGEGTPVWHGFVDIQTVDLFGDAEWTLDTDVDNGFFSFAWEPPRDVPLRLIIRCDDGFMEEPVTFRYEGKKLDLGRVRLTRFPTIRVRMRLPDGSWAKDVWAYPADEWIANRSLGAKGAPAVGWENRIRIPSREGGTVRLVLEENDTDFRILRDVDLVVDQLYEFDVNVRPGPIAVRVRLRDANGDGVRARFRLGDAEEQVETGPEGWFSASVPHGGLFDAHLAALLVPGAGWMPVGGNPGVAFVLDADAAAADVTQPLARRVLVLTRGVTAVRLLGEQGVVWSCESEDNGDRVRLSPPLPAGDYRWVRGGLYVFGPAATPAWRFREGDPGVLVTVNDRGWTLIDAR